MAISLNQRNAPVSAGDPLAAPVSATARLEDAIGNLRKTVRVNELIFFTSQLSLMLEVGTSLGVALGAMAVQTENPRFSKVLRAVLADIEEGRQFSDALRKHPEVFSNTYISMVMAGETGGFLKKVLDRIAQMQEKRQNLMAQLRSTLTYPAVLAALAIVVIIFVLVGVLPRFTSFFEGKESLLPVTTLFLMGASASLRSYWWAYIISCVAFMIGIKVWIATTLGRKLVDWLLLNSPVTGKLASKIYTSQLLRTLGHLMESQVPLIEALEVTKSTFANQYYRRFIQRLREHVEQGGRFSQPFSTSPYILESVKQMVATGEEVGDLPKVMLRLSEFYDTEADRDLKALASMIEPVALIVLGALVGLISASVILPLFNIANAVR